MFQSLCQARAIKHVLKILILVLYQKQWIHRGSGASTHCVHMTFQPTTKGQIPKEWSVVRRCGEGPYSLKLLFDQELVFQAAECSHTILSALEVRRDMRDQARTRDTPPPPPPLHRGYTFYLLPQSLPRGMGQVLHPEFNTG